MKIRTMAGLLFFLFLPHSLEASILKVGPGQSFATIERAYGRAKPGDIILVYPLPGNRPYEKVALSVNKKNITFQGVSYKKKYRVKLSGKGYNYTGAGRVPRGIFQFNKGADHCTLRGFDIFEAHNNTHNGAGVRINQANHTVVLDCEIRNNDMGIMSGGEVSRKTGLNQQIVKCLIHHNGNFKDPGYNHNLYLGGTSVTLRGCEVHSSLTGHNVKSRAHYNRVEYCYIHDSANREIDFVDAKGNTDQPNSHSVLLGNIIVKAQNMKGNRGTIHFGQDGGKGHQGTLYLIHNTVITPYGTQVVHLSTPGAGAFLINNIFWNGGVKNNRQKLFSLQKASPSNLKAIANWFSYGYRDEVKQYGRVLAYSYLAPAKKDPPFVSPAKGNYRLRLPVATLVNQGLVWKKIPLPAVPGDRPSKELKIYQYKQPLGLEKRSTKGRPDLGAYEYGRR